MSNDIRLVWKLRISLDGSYLFLVCGFLCHDAVLFEVYTFQNVSFPSNIAGGSDGHDEDSGFSRLQLSSKMRKETT